MKLRTLPAARHRAAGAVPGGPGLHVGRDQPVDLDLRRNNEKVLQAQLQATNDRFDAGEVTKTDVAQAQSRLQGATADRISAEGRSHRARSRSIARWSGRSRYSSRCRHVPPNLPLKEEEVLAPRPAAAARGRRAVHRGCDQGRHRHAVLRAAAFGEPPGLGLAARTSRRATATTPPTARSSACSTVPLYQAGRAGLLRAPGEADLSAGDAPAR